MIANAYYSFKHLRAGGGSPWDPNSSNGRARVVAAAKTSTLPIKSGVQLAMERLRKERKQRFHPATTTEANAAAGLTVASGAEVDAANTSSTKTSPASSSPGASAPQLHLFMQEYINRYTLTPAGTHTNFFLSVASPFHASVNDTDVAFMTPSAASHASSAASSSAQRERERDITATAERSREEEEEAVADGERHSILLSIKYDSTNRF